MNTFKLIFATVILFSIHSQLTAQPQLLTKTQNIPFEFHKISEIRNGYTLQSNSSPQQLWLDLNNPEFLHAVFINSQFKEPPFADRSCIYFGSTDNGYTWIQLGSVPDTSRSGFPAIYGTADGAAVITNHSNYFGLPTRTGLFIDENPFNYNFSAYDPGTQSIPMWPRHIVTPDGNILIAALSDSIELNYFNISTKTFSGWSAGGTSDPESYTFSISDGGKIGFTYIGGEGVNEGDVIYFESPDGGLTWGPRTTVFNCPAEQGIAVGALRGISLNFSGEEPCIAFEVCQQDFNAGYYYPGLPNEILFWSPNVNGGNPKVIADSSNVPFYPSLNPQDVFAPLCRPVIGRSNWYEHIFVAFSASTENVYVGTDSMTYFAGYLMISSNGGESWFWQPEKFTPETPLLDWKYISIAPINPWLGDALVVRLTMQADSLEAIPNPLILSAQYYYSLGLIMTIGVDENPGVVNTFRLNQNYPNPFNPFTTISYSVPSQTLVQLKVFDVLGNEVATLVNEEKPAGNYEVKFNVGQGSSPDIASGIYFYQLKSGNYLETKKMVLLK